MSIDLEPRLGEDMRMGGSRRHPAGEGKRGDAWHGRGRIEPHLEPRLSPVAAEQGPRTGRNLGGGPRPSRRA